MQLPDKSPLGLGFDRGSMELTTKLNEASQSRLVRPGVGLWRERMPFFRCLDKIDRIEGEMICLRYEILSICSWDPLECFWGKSELEMAE